MGATGLLFPAPGSLTMISALDIYCGTAPPHLAHLLAPLFPPRITHAPGRGPGTPVIWGASPGGPDGAERTWLSVDAGSFPPRPLRAHQTLEPSLP